MSDLTAAAGDHFSYLIVYAPEFPKEDQTTSNLEYERLLAMLREIEERAAETPKRQWLKLSIIETEQSRNALQANDSIGANGLLHSAEDHFRAYLGGKRTKTTLVAGPDGRVEPVDD